MTLSIALAASLALAGQVPAGSVTTPKSEARTAADAIRPTPVSAIPDDPPPHEGALIDLPYFIEPPDILVVELLEALPGRPITGERLVRPDGTISLGFYGSLHVRGLTVEQAKVKIIHHFREYLNDETLGLIQDRGEPGEDAPVAAPNAIPGTARPPLTPAPDVPSRPSAPPVIRPTPPGPSTGRTRPVPALVRAAGLPPQEPAHRPDGPVRPFPAATIPPDASTRVFVDVTSFNSKIYYVQGDVGTPGRLPFTGKDTVLDALNYAGGLIPTAEPLDVHLFRPARGGKPARDFKVDLTAIQKGDAVANLQVFPGDRLVVGRNPIVQKTIEIDRAAASLNAVFQSLAQQSLASRSVGAAAEVMNGTRQAQREATVKEWADFLWSISSKEGGALLDEKAFREAVMKRLAPNSPDPKK